MKTRLLDNALSAIAIYLAGYVAMMVSGWIFLLVIEPMVSGFRGIFGPPPTTGRFHDRFRRQRALA